MTKYIIGIDPGANGGVCIMNSDHAVINCIKMPHTPQDILDSLLPYKDDAVCYLERVQGMPGQGGMAMFNFGKGYGHIEMALMALKIPTISVTPQKWQKHYQLGKLTNHSKTEWKNVLKAKAQQLFPDIKVTLAIADALLICNYGFYNEK